MWDRCLLATLKTVVSSILHDIQKSDHTEYDEYDSGVDHHNNLDFGVGRVLLMSRKVPRTMRIGLRWTHILRDLWPGQGSSCRTNEQDGVGKEFLGVSLRLVSLYLKDTWDECFTESVF